MLFESLGNWSRLPFDTAFFIVYKRDVHICLSATSRLLGRSTESSEHMQTTSKNKALVSQQNSSVKKVALEEASAIIVWGFSSAAKDATSGGSDLRASLTSRRATKVRMVKIKTIARNNKTR